MSDNHLDPDLGCEIFVLSPTEGCDYAARRRLRAVAAACALRQGGQLQGSGAGVRDPVSRPEGLEPLALEGDSAALASG
jgi:hypothetical protein